MLRLRATSLSTALLRPVLRVPRTCAVGQTEFEVGRWRRFRSTVASEAKEENPTAKRTAAGVILAGITAATAYLCSWQVQRYYWKLEKIEERRVILQRDPRPLQEIVTDLPAGIRADDVFTRVSCDGVFDHSRQVLLGPRSPPAGMSIGGTTPTGAPNTSGWDVITPLELTDGSRVLVNRGWVARDNMAAILQPKGTQCVEGILKEGDKENKYGFNDVALGLYRWLDLPTVAAATGSEPVLVVASTGPDVDDLRTFPRARPVDSFMSFHVEPMTHATYAATWGSLAVAGVVMTSRFMRGL